MSPVHAMHSCGNDVLKLLLRMRSCICVNDEQRIHLQLRYEAHTETVEAIGVILLSFKGDKPVLLFLLVFMGQWPQRVAYRQNQGEICYTEVINCPIIPKSSTFNAPLSCGTSFQRSFTNSSNSNVKNVFCYFFIQNFKWTSPCIGFNEKS